MPTDPDWIEAEFSRGQVWNAIVAACETRGIDGQRAEDVAFHMTDWFDDFERMRVIFQDCSKTSPEEVADMLHMILIHAPHHMAAASKLFTGDPVTDVFEIGAVDSEAQE